MTPRHADRRLSLVLWSALLFSVFLIVHLFRIQVLQHEFYLAEAERQHKRKIVLPPERGDILDRRGDPLALSAEGLNVYAVPERIADKKQVSRILSTYLDLPESIIYRRISSPKPFVMILQKVNPLALAPLQELNLKGVGFISSPKRYYPHHSLAAQIIGYVGVDEKGLSGLEFMYDRKLCGEPGWLVVQRDAKGNPYKLLDYPLHRQSNGKSLRLTIDAQFQEIVEEALCRAVIASGAENGCAVAVNPDNGQLLAVANCPAVDLNSNRKFKENDFLNLAVNLPFEPGSTFKAFSAGALLARGCVEPGDSVFCENGVFRINRRTVRDVHRYGALSFTEVISRSSNIGMTKLIRKIGDRDLYRSLRAFGFGSYTGSCFIGEDRGYLPTPAEWDSQTKTSLAMGYSVLATPVQMALAYASIANRGILYEPALVAEIFDEQGKTYFSFKPRRVRRVMTQDVALKLTRALVQVTEDGGTGTAAAVSGFKVAGKTGTSMKAKPGSGYGGAGYFSSFGGFFPVDDPQIAMFILINDPDFEYRWGGKCAAPVFSEIIHNTLLSDCDVIDRTRLGLPGTGIQTAASTPPEAAASLPPAKNLLAESGATSSIAGDGSPNKAHDSKHAVMPDIRGLTVRKAVARLSSLGLKAQLVEGGIKVKEQYPGPGAILPRGALCSLTGLPAATRGRHPGHRLTADNSFSLAQRTSHTVKRTPFLQQTEKEEQ